MSSFILKLKRAVKSILETQFLGSCLQQMTAIMLRIVELSHKVLSSFLLKQPYARKIAYIGDSERFNKIYQYFLLLKNSSFYLPFNPKISIIVPVYRVDPRFFKEMLLSVVYQTYSNWELCIVDDCSQMPELGQMVARLQKLYPSKIKFAANSQNLHISQTSNKCLELATGEYCALLDHDDRLLPNALGEMVRFINLHDKPEILYSDERTIDSDGFAVNPPFFKPAWSPFTHLAMNYTTHLTVYRTDLVRQVGGFRSGFEGAQDHDLMLRMTEKTTKPVVHVPLCLYQWRAHEASTARANDAKPYAAKAGERAVTEACLRRGRPAKVEFEMTTFHYRVRFDLPAELPLISIIIPSRNAFDQISACLSSIFEKTTYPNYEVIVVDNGSDDQRCLELFASYRSRGRFTVIADPRPFNFAAQNRRGVEASRGAYVLFLNNDTQVLSRDWLHELLQYAQFPEVGAVGCKLLYPDGRIQHAGILGAGRMVALHAGVNLEKDHNLYCQMLNTAHETLAVTGACLLIARDKYESVGGFDEVFLQNGYGDVDFCLKLRAQGWTNIYTPYAILTHHESKTRKLSYEEFEKQTIVAKWGQVLVTDPYLNPNLSYGEFYKITPEKLAMDMYWDGLNPEKWLSTSEYRQLKAEEWL